MSILLTTTTTFLPQSRIASRNARSLSVNGRSAEVTNSTRSARGTNSRVSASCSRRMALVPGVSTTLMLAQRSRAGAVTTSSPVAARWRGVAAVAQQRDAATWSA